MAIDTTEMTEAERMEALEAAVPTNSREETQALIVRSYERQKAEGMLGMYIGMVNVSPEGRATLIAVPMNKPEADTVIPAGEGLVIGLNDQLMEDLFTEWLFATGRLPNPAEDDDDADNN